MRLTEFEQKLERNGFWLKRRNKHPIYTDGTSTIVIPSGGPSLDRRLSKQLEINLRKAMEKRPKPVEKPRSEEVITAQPTQMFADKPVSKELSPVTPKTRTLSRDDAFKLFEPWRKSGQTNQQIVDRLKNEGFVKPSGKLFTPSDISQIALGSGGVRRANRRSLAELVAEEKLKEETTKSGMAQDQLRMIADIITSNLDDSTKRQVVKDLALKL